MKNFNKIIKLLDHTFILTKPPYNILDLGTNQGNFYKSCVENLGKVNIQKYVGVEASKELYDTYLSKLISHDVIMVNAAIHNISSKEIDLYSFNNNECNNIIGEGGFIWDNSTKITKIKTITLHDIIYSNFKSIDTYIDYLKIDIEGSEYNILNDIILHLPIIKQISIEFHDFVDESYRDKTLEFIRELESNGMKLIFNNKLDYLHNTNYGDCLFINENLEL